MIMEKARHLSAAHQREAEHHENNRRERQGMTDKTVRYDRYFLSDNLNKQQRLKLLEGN